MLYVLDAKIASQAFSTQGPPSQTCEGEPVRLANLLDLDVCTKRSAQM
jgi:hypothetical protein